MALFKNLFFYSCLLFLIPLKAQSVSPQYETIKLGIAQSEKYLPLLQNKKVAVVGNQTSQLDGIHLVDDLIERGVKVMKVFSPEHGFRGKADAGESVTDGKDLKTGLPIISLYGDNKKPTASQLSGIAILVFDIQDVGARFYTYISTLHYMMEAAAEQNIPLIVLDRPNPNGSIVDGPVLEEKYKSFVGMHPIPVVHGMTIGEYALMINGEKWLKNGVQCDLTIIKCENYNRKMTYELPIMPSPNLPNMRSIYLYPSLCFFEGTVVSVGRGTLKPFQQIGHPAFRYYDYSFVPKPMDGAKDPKLKNKRCFGIDFTDRTAKSFKEMDRLDLSYLIEFYKNYPKQSQFFSNYFNLLAGNSSLQDDIKAGKTELQIRNRWEEGVTAFKKMREPYLLYP